MTLYNMFAIYTVKWVILASIIVLGEIALSWYWQIKQIMSITCCLFHKLFVYLYAVFISCVYVPIWTNASKDKQLIINQGRA